jgi:hypothetical protein
LALCGIYFGFKAYSLIHNDFMSMAGLTDPPLNFKLKADAKLEQRSLEDGTIQATMSNAKPLVNSDVTVDRVYCPNAPCTYYCHGGSEDLSLDLAPTQYSTYTAAETGPVKFPTGASPSLSGSELTVELPTHSCAQSGVKIGQLNVQGDFRELVPICDPSQPGMTCKWLGEKVTLLKVLKPNKKEGVATAEDYDCTFLKVP